MWTSYLSCAPYPKVEWAEKCTYLFDPCSSSAIDMKDANMLTISYNLSQFPIRLRLHIRLLFMQDPVRQYYLILPLWICRPISCTFGRVLPLCCTVHELFPCPYGPMTLVGIFSSSPAVGAGVLPRVGSGNRFLPLRVALGTSYLLEQDLYTHGLLCTASLTWVFLDPG